jgi:hypothetical protein
MKINRLHLSSLFAACAVLLSACGGGGSSAPAVAPNTPVIARADATDDISISKSAHTIITNTLVNFGDLESIWLKSLTGSNIGGMTAASAPISQSCFTGTVSSKLYKTRTGAGLNAGDYWENTYTNCVMASGTATLNGIATVTALTNTTSDVSASGSAYSLPFSVTALSYQHTLSGTTTTYSRTINFTTFTTNSAAIPTRSVVATTNAAGFSRDTPTLLINYKNLNSSITTASNGVTNANNTFDLVATGGGTTLAMHNTVVTAAPTYYSSTFTSANYTATNINGAAGTLTGTQSGSSTSITVDYGSNGTIDDSYSVASSAL